MISTGNVLAQYSCEEKDWRGSKLLIGTKSRDSIGSVKLNFLFFYQHKKPGYHHQICQTQVAFICQTLSETNTAIKVCQHTA